MKQFLPQNFNDLLALMFFPFLLVWIVMLSILYKYVDVDFISTLSLGTATGVILSKFSDIYQYYFRTRPPTEGKEKSTITTNSTVTKTDDGK